MGPLRDEVLIMCYLGSSHSLLSVLPVLELSCIVRCYAQQA